MSNLSNLLLGFHGMCASMIFASFIILAISSNDELDEYATTKGLKGSTAITALGVLGYGFYMLLIGKSTVSLNVVFIVIEAIAILFFAIYFLTLKGFDLSIQVKNKKLLNSIMTVLNVISIACVISSLLKIDFFSNEAGFIRYDITITIFSLIIVALLASFIPSEKVTRAEFQKREIFSNKLTKYGTIYVIVQTLALAAYAVYVKFLRG